MIWEWNLIPDIIMISMKEVKNQKIIFEGVSHALDMDFNSENNLNKH